MGRDAEESQIKEEEEDGRWRLLERIWVPGPPPAARGRHFVLYFTNFDF